MHDARGSGGIRRAVGVLFALAVLWVVVYWWWPAEPPITIAPGPALAQAASSGGDGASARAAAPAVAAPAAPMLPAAPRAASSTGVVAPTFREHTLANGETLEMVSQRYFGTTAHAGAIARANPLMSPAQLRAGRVIRVPLDPANVQGTPTPGTPAPTLPMGEYVVQQGDSLARIARRIYRDESLSHLIFEANRDVLRSPERIRVGQTLKIPERPATTQGERVGGGPG